MTQQTQVPVQFCAADQGLCNPVPVQENTVPVQSCAADEGACAAEEPGTPENGACATENSAGAAEYGACAADEGACVAEYSAVEQIMVSAAIRKRVCSPSPLPPLSPAHANYSVGE